MSVPKAGIIDLLSAASQKVHQIRGEILTQRVQQHASEQARRDDNELVMEEPAQTIMQQVAAKLHMAPGLRSIADLYASGEQGASPRTLMPTEVQEPKPKAILDSQRPPEILTGLRVATSGAWQPSTGMLPTIEVHAVQRTTLPGDPEVHKLPSTTTTSYRTTEEVVYEVLAGQMDDDPGVPPGFFRRSAVGAGNPQSCEGFVSLLLSPRTTRERIEEEEAALRSRMQAYNSLSQVQPIVAPTPSEQPQSVHPAASDSGVLIGSPMADQDGSVASSRRRPTLTPQSNLGKDLSKDMSVHQLTSPSPGPPEPACSSSNAPEAKMLSNSPELTMLNKGKGGAAAATSASPLGKTQPRAVQSPRGFVSPRVPLGMAPAPSAARKGGMPPADGPAPPTQAAARANQAVPAGKGGYAGKRTKVVIAASDPSEKVQAAAAAVAAAAAASTRQEVLARLQRVNEVFNKRHSGVASTKRQGPAVAGAQVGAPGGTKVNVRRPASGAEADAVPDNGNPAPTAAPLASSSAAATKTELQIEAERQANRRKLYMQLLQRRQIPPAPTQALRPDLSAPADTSAPARGRVRSRANTAGGGTALAEGPINGFVIVSRRGTRELPDSVCTSLSLEQLLPQGGAGGSGVRRTGADWPGHRGSRGSQAWPGAEEPIVCESVSSMQAKTSPMKPRYEPQHPQGSAGGSGAGSGGGAAAHRTPPPGIFKKMGGPEKGLPFLATGAAAARRGAQTARGPVPERQVPPPRAVSTGRATLATGRLQRPTVTTPRRVVKQNQPRSGQRTDSAAAAGRPRQADAAVILKNTHTGRAPGGADVRISRRSASALVARTGGAQASMDNNMSAWQVKEMGAGVPPAPHLVSPLGLAHASSPWLAHELVEAWQDAADAAHLAEQQAAQAAVDGTSEHPSRGVTSSGGGSMLLPLPGVWARSSNARSSIVMANQDEEGAEPHTPAMPRYAAMPAVPDPIPEVDAVTDGKRAAHALQAGEKHGTPASASPGTRMRRYANAAANLLAGGFRDAASPTPTRAHQRSPLRTPSPGPRPELHVAPVIVPTSPAPGISAATSPGLKPPTFTHLLPGILSPRSLGASTAAPATLTSPAPRVTGSASISRLPSHRPSHEDLALSEMSEMSRIFRKTLASHPSTTALPTADTHPHHTTMPIPPEDAIGLSPSDILKKTLRRNGPAPRASPVKPHSATMGLPPHLAGFKGPGATKAAIGYAASTTPSPTASPSHLIPRYAAATAASSAKVSPLAASPAGLPPRPQGTPTRHTHTSPPSHQTSPRPHAEPISPRAAEASPAEATTPIPSPSPLMAHPLALSTNMLVEMILAEGAATQPPSPSKPTASETINIPTDLEAHLRDEPVAEPLPAMPHADAHVTPIAMHGLETIVSSTAGAIRQTGPTSTDALRTSSDTPPSDRIQKTSSVGAPAGPRASASPASPIASRTPQADSTGYAMRLQASRLAQPPTAQPPRGTQTSLTAPADPPESSRMTNSLDMGLPTLDEPASTLDTTVTPKAAEAVVGQSADVEIHAPGTVGASTLGKALLHHLPAGLTAGQLLNELRRGVSAHFVASSVDAKAGGVGPAAAGPAFLLACLGLGPGCLRTLAAQGKGALQQHEAAASTSDGGVAGGEARKVRVAVDHGSVVLSLRCVSGAGRKDGGETAATPVGVDEEGRMLVVSFGVPAGPSGPVGTSGRMGRRVLVHVQERLGRAPTEVHLEALNSRGFASLVLALNAALLLAHGRMETSDPLHGMVWVMEQA